MTAIIYMIAALIHTGLYACIIKTHTHVHLRDWILPLPNNIPINI